MTVNQSEFVGVPLEHASVRTDTSLKAPLSIETRPLDTVLLNHTQSDKEGSGRPSFPGPPSLLNFQSKLAGRLSFPSVTSVSTSKACDPVKVATWAAPLCYHKLVYLHLLLPFIILPHHLCMQLLLCLNL